MVNIDKENLHAFQTTRGISMKFSRNLSYDNIKSQKTSVLPSL